MKDPITLSGAPLLPAATHDEANAYAAIIGRLGSAVDAMRERTELLEAVVENFPGGIALYDRALQMVLCNQRMIEMLELPGSLFANGHPSMEAFFRFNAERGEYGEGNPAEQVARRMALLGDRCAHIYERTRPNGHVMEVRGVLLATGGFVTTYFDVTEQRRAQAMIAHLAHHDYLTDLPNRALFTDRLQAAVAPADLRRMVAVHCLDLDGFKRVNDTLGHKAGDALLRGVADRLRACIGTNDTAARLGGDEFAIVQPAIPEQASAKVLASRMIEAIRTTMPSANGDLAIGVSVGIAFAPIDGSTVDEILLRADAALYRSKAAGRGRWMLSSEF